MTIDSCYENLIAKLTAENKIIPLSKHFLNLHLNHERVLYVYNLIETTHHFPSVVNVTKTENVSTYYRNLGNQYFQRMDNHVAYQYYNLSLLHAPLGSEDYVVALSNRSAVLGALKMYAECLNDINTVFSYQYPCKLKEKLSRRYKLCKEGLSKVPCKQEESELSLDAQDLVALKGPTNSNYPYASAKIKVVYNEEMGRHVIASEDIKVGEILVKEKPYFTLLLKSQILLSCSYCLSRNLNMMPCDKCCFAMYCSEECKIQAWKDYHEVECPLMATLIHLDFTKLELLALRTAIKARNDHNSWMDLFQTIKLAEGTVNTENWGKVKVGDNWLFDSKYYASIHTLASNVEKRSVSDIFQKAVTAAVFLNLLKNTIFFEIDDEKIMDDAWKCTAGILLLHIMTSPTNMHGISTTSQPCPGGSYDKDISIASAPFAFHSLINHSCAPNVVRHSEQVGLGTLTLVALRPIRKGSQLFDNYGSHHALMDVWCRQKELTFQYKFKCRCEACINNWPMYMEMKMKMNIKLVPVKLVRKKNSLLSSDVMSKLQKGDKYVALKLFKPLCELIDNLDCYAPCVELADCQECLKQCLVIMQGLVPYGFGNSIEWSAKPPV